MSSLDGLTIADLRRLLEAFSSIRFREFAVAIGTERDERYTKGVWPQFQGHPLWFAANRSEPQGANLLALANEKLRMAETSGRAIGCPGEGQCHERDGRCKSCGEVARVCHLEVCSIHRDVTKEQIIDRILRCFEPIAGTPRNRDTRERVIDTVVAMAAYAPEPLRRDRVEGILDHLIADGALAVATKPGWEKYLERPLEALCPGEHANECPVMVERWNEQTIHDPDRCAFVEVVTEPESESEEGDFDA